MNTWPGILLFLRASIQVYVSERTDVEMWRQAFVEIYSWRESNVCFWLLHVTSALYV